MPRPSAVATRPEIDALAAVVGTNCSCQPPFRQPEMAVCVKVPPSSRIYRLHTPLEFVNRKLPPSVCETGLATVLPGSTYGTGGAGGAKLGWFGSHVVGRN